MNALSAVQKAEVVQSLCIQTNPCPFQLAKCLTLSLKYFPLQLKYIFDYQKTYFLEYHIAAVSQ